MEVFLTAQAHRDIAAIKGFIAKKNLSTAERVAAKLYNQAAGLAKNPKIGVSISAKFGIDTDLRMWVVPPNIILYKIDNERIIVTRVINERQDYLAVLGFADYSEVDGTSDE